MRAKMLLSLAAIAAAASTAYAQDALPAPKFHHLHLNSTKPDAAIDFYVKAFPSTERTTFAGAPALKAGPIFVLFTKVSSPPPLLPQSAFWHFGWHVTEERAEEKRFKETGVTMLPLYTGDGDGSVWINSDSWPGTGGTLGRTKEQIAEAKEKNLQPTHAATGFAYIGGPEGAKI